MKVLYDSFVIGFLAVSTITTTGNAHMFFLGILCSYVGILLLRNLPKG